MKPKCWTNIYPYGTKSGEEEAKFFNVLARTKYSYRSVGAIVKETGLSPQRVDEIINKYAHQINPPLIYRHDTQDNHWGYWEGLPEDVYNKDGRSLSTKDKDRRIDEHLNDKVVTMGIDYSDAPDQTCYTVCNELGEVINQIVQPEKSSGCMIQDKKEGRKVEWKEISRKQIEKWRQVELFQRSIMDAEYSKQLYDAVTKTEALWLNKKDCFWDIPYEADYPELTNPYSDL